ncbi:hypothetical protein ACFC6L_28220 [Kitasatospora phosalacinea]|uniref:hypothetical protein n=1 Tax=Kitasatospora phosalacinea TaxID=2065 RepID=UPI0035D97A9D
MSGRQKAFLAGLVAALAVVAAVLLWPDPKHPTAAPPPPSPSPSPTPSPSPSKTYPYPYYPPGTCLLMPWISGVKDSTVTPCDQPHDAETTANVVMPDGLADDRAVNKALLELCAPSLEAVQRQQGGFDLYNNSPIVPLTKYYQQGYRDASCTVTVSNQQSDRKLTAPLHP